MRRLVLSVLGATALAGASIANAAVTVNAGTVVNLNNPNPSQTVPVSSVQTVGNVTSINFGLNTIFNNVDPTHFTSGFTISDSLAGIYSIVVSTASDNVFFTDGTLTQLLSGGGTLDVASLTPGDGGLELRLGPPGIPLSAGNYRLTINGTSPNAGSFTGNVFITSVPEPGTWALMLLGFGALGMAMRRSRRQGTLLAQVA